MEVCVDSVQSALKAHEGGAHRLELCTGLSEGGLTPSLGLFRKVKDIVHPIPINVLIRPRPGDFCYTVDELSVMEKDIQIFKEEGASGFVIGVLTSTGNVDTVACSTLLGQCQPLPVTFHRAFDWTPDPIKALEILKELGFKRLLTSGQKESAEQGVKLLTELVSKANNQISIMPGGGITENNLVDILQTTGATEFHASASRQRESDMKLRSTVCMSAGSQDFVWKECCSEKVRKMVALANTVLKKRTHSNV